MKSNRNKHQKNRSILYLVSIFGAVLVLSLLAFNHNQRQKKKAEVIYTETKKALELLAINLDKGLGKIAHLNQFETTVKKIYNH